MQKYGSAPSSIAFALSFQTADVPSVRYFCIFATVVIFLDYVYQITFFAGCMVLTGRREAQGLHALTCRPPTPKSEAGMHVVDIEYFPSLLIGEFLNRRI